MWPRLLNAAVGIWLMASPSVFDLTSRPKANYVVCGALAASFAIIAIWEVTRGLRWLNFLIGLWLPISVFVFEMGGAAMASGILSGVGLIGLSLVGGEVKEDLAGGWSALFSGRNRNVAERH